MDSAWSKQPPTADEVRERQFTLDGAWAWHRWNETDVWSPIALRVIEGLPGPAIVEWCNGSQWFGVTGQYAIVGEWGGWAMPPSEAAPVPQSEAGDPWSALKMDFEDEHNDRVDALRASTERPVRNLLAVVFRDGGQRADSVPLAEACAAAEALVRVPAEVAEAARRIIAESERQGVGMDVDKQAVYEAAEKIARHYLRGGK